MTVCRSESNPSLGLVQDKVAEGFQVLGSGRKTLQTGACESRGVIGVVRHCGFGEDRALRALSARFLYTQRSGSDLIWFQDVGSRRPRWMDGIRGVI